MKRLALWFCMAMLIVMGLMQGSAAANSIEGKWNVSFNGYAGVMEIRGDSGGYSGRFNLQAHGNWEEMLDLSISGNRISFRRAAADQRYRGKITGNSMSGNFTQGGSGNYPWKADRQAGPPPAHTGTIVGSWTISFNGYPGTMEIRGDSGGYSGRFNLQAHGNWEEMLDLNISGNRISFRRAAADQRYRGKITGASMSGNFTQGGSGNYPWKADRQAGPPAPPAHTETIVGAWTVSFNGYPGTMEISGGGGRYAGRFNLHGNWEEMLDLSISGNRISFRRAAADQRYSGRISGDSMSGNFTQSGSGNYPWKADRQAGPPPTHTGAIAGAWTISFNGYPGTMEIRGNHGGYSGRFNLHGNWEAMLDLSINGNRISFRRAAADQHYSGRITGATMSGNFTQGGSGNYPWKADRQ